MPQNKQTQNKETQETQPNTNINKITKKMGDAKTTINTKKHTETTNRHETT